MSGSGAFDRTADGRDASKGRRKIMRKIVCLLTFCLLYGLGVAQEPAPNQAGFQGLWKERTGHSLHLGYGFLVDKWYNQHAKACQPFRFDLDYQYDIPWKFKRTNFFVETGLGYRWINSEEKSRDEKEIRVVHQTNHRVLCHLSIGLKVYFTDWLYIFLDGGFNFGYVQVLEEETEHPLSPSIQESYLLRTMRDDLMSLGVCSAAGIVGQIRQFSISLGYRFDLLNTNSDFYDFPFSSKYIDWFITLGVGYHF